MSYIRAKYCVNSISLPQIIKNTAFLEYANNLYPAYSASGQDVWSENYVYDGEALILSAVGARCGKVFKASGKWGLCANTHVLIPNKSLVLVDYLYYILNSEEWWVRGGTAQPFIKVEDSLRQFIYVPDIEFQKKLVYLLNDKCEKINTLCNKIQYEIDKLVEYKTSLITEAVTKGITAGVKTKESNIGWIGSVPSHWKVYRIADVYCDRNERGDETLPILSVSINSGVSDKEIDDSEKERIFIRSEDKTKYKRVYPGDFTYNMMRAWQGGMGAVRVEGMVSPAYVVAKPTGRVEIESRFIEALLRSPLGVEEINRYSYGIMDFRKRLYWPQFRMIKIALPDIKEQRAIADYIDKKTSEIDELIKIKAEQIKKLEEYKKSIVYEVVTGKKRLSKKTGVLSYENDERKSC